jgi:hypothetical protein
MSGHGDIPSAPIGGNNNSAQLPEFDPSDNPFPDDGSAEFIEALFPESFAELDDAGLPSAPPPPEGHDGALAAFLGVEDTTQVSLELGELIAAEDQPPRFYSDLHEEPSLAEQAPSSLQEAFERNLDELFAICPLSDFAPSPVVPPPAPVLPPPPPPESTMPFRVDFTGKRMLFWEDPQVVYKRKAKKALASEKPLGAVSNNPRAEEVKVTDLTHFSREDIDSIISRSADELLSQGAVEAIAGSRKRKRETPSSALDGEMHRNSTFDPDRDEPSTRSEVDLSYPAWRRRGGVSSLSASYSIALHG